MGKLKVPARDCHCVGMDGECDDNCLLYNDIQAIQDGNIQGVYICVGKTTYGIGPTPKRAYNDYYQKTDFNGWSRRNCTIYFSDRFVG